MELKDFKQIHLLDKIIGWGKKLICWQLLAVLTAGIIVFVGIWFYPDCVIYYIDLAIYWFTKDSEITRNVIYFFAAVIGACLLYWRTKIALREANTSEQNFKITEQNFKITEQNIKITEQNIRTGNQKIVHEEISGALKQLAGENAFIRLSGISDLEKFADTHKEESKKVARILVSFVQDRSVERSTRYNLLALTGMDNPSTHRAERLDIEAAVIALARITSEIEKRGEFSEEYGETKHQICDLQNTDLRGFRLNKADMSKFNLAKVDMRGASLLRADLSEANLSFVNFHGIVRLMKARFNSAYLYKATFTEAYIVKADFTDADLRSANFTGASLKGVKIGDATLKDTNLTDAQLLNMHGLQQHQLDEAFRLKGHKTLIRLAEGHSLEPPPEIEELPDIES